jgi:hypothetical protein
MPPEQHVDELPATRLHRRVAAADATPLTHGENLLRNRVRHTQESLHPESG